MIRTLVVDDDYRVARLHAASVERVPGFTCVGEAHSAAETRTAVTELHPALLLLDLYLPDEDGLSLLKSLGTAEHPPPDCIVVTAARDLANVRTAMHLGAIYYLVKPFGFAQLRDQLEAYRRWRELVELGGEADQGRVDTLYSLLRAPAAAASARRGLSPTMSKVFEVIRKAPAAIGASDVAAQLGVSRPTAQRHLAELLRRGVIELDLAYGSAGRPENLYHVAKPASGSTSSLS
ncbi:MAG TPA: response regulator [Acidothermaceae bacterium]|jgi:response regulator of citrate/malate metabolism|nr:response regulator [Acidothermaceae bacterium]